MACARIPRTLASLVRAPFAGRKGLVVANVAYIFPFREAKGDAERSERRGMHDHQPLSPGERGASETSGVCAGKMGGGRRSGDGVCAGGFADTNLRVWACMAVEKV